MDGIWLSPEVPGLAFHPSTLYLSQSPLLPDFSQALPVPAALAPETHMDVPGWKPLNAHKHEYAPTLKSAGESKLPKAWNGSSTTLWCRGSCSLLPLVASHSAVAQWLSGFPSSCLPRAQLPTPPCLPARVHPSPPQPMPQEGPG